MYGASGYRTSVQKREASADKMNRRSPKKLVNRSLLFALMLTTVAWAAMAGTLYAQPGRGRGGPPRGRGGGPPGGGPSGFLARLDRNHNGMLDADEIQGRTRMMLERIGGDGRLDLSRPVPLKAVQRAFEKMRNRRSRDRDDDRRGRGRDDDDRDRRGRSSSSEPDNEPLVPGFGELDLFEPVPGFGTMGEKFAVTITDEDRQEARRTLSRHDRNNDGILDEREIRHGRWREDVLMTDRNRDGNLTLNELALRYAVRRTEQDNDSDGSNGDRGNNARGGSSSDDDSDRRERFIRMAFGRYDRNNDGTVKGDEMKRLGGRGDRYDLNNDDKIPRDEFAKAMSGRGNRRGDDNGRRSRFFSRRENDRNGSDNRGGGDSAESASPKSYRRPRPTERVAQLEGLPEWFARYDTNENGQVEMAEYATTWNQNVVADFSQFDLNGDGVVTPNECLKAVDRGAVRGAPTPLGSPETGFSGGESSSGPDPRGAGERGASPAERGPGGDGNSDVSPAYVQYAVGVIKKYDNNRDGVLTSDEWKNMADDYSSADADEDGRLTPVELAKAYASRK